MEDVQLAAGERFEAAKGFGVGEGEALEDDAGEFAGLEGDGLAGFAAGVGDFVEHVGGVAEAGVVGIDVGLRGAGGHAGELVVGVVLADVGPDALAAFEQAEAGAVAEEVDAAAEADFVGEAVVAGLAAEDGLGELDAKLGTEVGVEEGPALLGARGDGGDGGGAGVGAGGDDAGVEQRGVLAEFIDDGGRWRCRWGRGAGRASRGG